VVPMPRPWWAGATKSWPQNQNIAIDHALHTTDIGTIEGDDPDLPQIPPLAEMGGLLGQVRVQFANRSFHPAEIEIGAKVEVLGARRANSDPHTRFPHVWSCRDVLMRSGMPP
jgi:hypothetical protein